MIRIRTGRAKVDAAEGSADVPTASARKTPEDTVLRAEGARPTPAIYRKAATHKAGRGFDNFFSRDGRRQAE